MTEATGDCKVPKVEISVRTICDSCGEQMFPDARFPTGYKHSNEPQPRCRDPQPIAVVPLQDARKPAEAGFHTCHSVPAREPNDNPNAQSQ